MLARDREPCTPQVLGEVVNGVPVIKSGTDFRNYSRICLHFTDNHLGAAAAARAVAHRSRDGQDGLLVTGGGCGQRRSESEWVLEEVVKADVCDAAAQELVEVYREELSRSMDRVIGELGTAMDATFARIRTQETNCSDWVADSILDGLNTHCYPHTHIDCVILNSGTLRADDVFPPGPFLLKHLVTLLPMLDEMAVLSLSGAQIIAALENGVSMCPKLEGRFPCVAGLRFQFDSSRQPGNRVLAESVLVCDKHSWTHACVCVCVHAYM